jgi:hypothetical protein
MNPGSALAACKYQKLHANGLLILGKASQRRETLKRRRKGGSRTRREQTRKSEAKRKKRKRPSWQNS